MAPKSGANKPPSFEKSVVASILLHAEETWDSAPLKMPGWFSRLQDDAASENPAFDALLKFGYVMTRGKVCVVSAAHAAALDDMSYGPFTYTDPAPTDPSIEAAIMAKVAAGWVFPTSGPTPAGMLEVPSRYIEAPEDD